MDLLTVIDDSPAREQEENRWNVERIVKRAGIDPADVCWDRTWEGAGSAINLIIGKDALGRVLGMTNIQREQGGVFQRDGRTYVVTQAPALVKKAKLESQRLLVERAVQRACLYAMGTAVQLVRPNWRWSSLSLLDYLLTDAKVVAIDTEFDVATNKPFLIGLSIGEQVEITRPSYGLVDILNRHLLRDDLIKVFHHAPADIMSLRAMGVDMRAPIYDTMLAHSTCYSDLPLGLAKVALFYFDGWHNWKGMQHNDPNYLSLDVQATYALHGATQQEMHRLGVRDVYEREVLPAMAICLAMEVRGLQVDKQRMDVLIAQAEEKRAALLASVKAFGDGVFAARIKVAQTEMDGLTIQLCHPRASKKCPTCADMKPIKAEITKLRGKINKWSATGFDPGNNEHLRWLLYEGLGLPEQHHYQTKKVTANSDAIAKLLTNAKVHANPAILTLLTEVKEYQHLGKMVSTFYCPPVDGDAVSHPELRIFGTGTGRVASGQDADLMDERSSSLSYNVLNWPEEARSIIVPHKRIGTSPALAATIVRDKDILDNDEEFEDAA
jgi:hypothetical protein